MYFIFGKKKGKKKKDGYRRKGGGKGGKGFLSFSTLNKAARSVI